MKKIMFNDRFGLTNAVIQGIKELTRRTIKNQSGNLVGQIQYTKKGSNLTYIKADFDNGISEIAPYAIGEVVAVAQSYKDITIDKVKSSEQLIYYKRYRVAWTNKMFIRACLMPHQIRILNIRAERLQDITDEDCFREYHKTQESIDSHYEKVLSLGGRIGDNILTPQMIFANLIDKINGKGTWNRNPFVWRIEFELIK